MGHFKIDGHGSIYHMYSIASPGEPLPSIHTRKIRAMAPVVPVPSGTGPLGAWTLPIRPGAIKCAFRPKCVTYAPGNFWHPCAKTVLPCMLVGPWHLRGLVSGVDRWGERRPRLPQNSRVRGAIWSIHFSTAVQSLCDTRKMSPLSMPSAC